MSLCHGQPLSGLTSFIWLQGRNLQQYLRHVVAWQEALDRVCCIPRHARMAHSTETNVWVQCMLHLSQKILCDSSCSWLAFCHWHICSPSNSSSIQPDQVFSLLIMPFSMNQMPVMCCAAWPDTCHPTCAQALWSSSRPDAHMFPGHAVLCWVAMLTSIIQDVCRL